MESLTTGLFIDPVLPVLSPMVIDLESDSTYPLESTFQHLGGKRGRMGVQRAEQIFPEAADVAMPS